MKKRVMIMLSALVGVGLAAPAALAATSLEMVHGSSPASGVAGKLSTTASGGTLPFTGVNLAVYVAAGIGALVVGFLLRRISRSESH